MSGVGEIVELALIYRQDVISASGFSRAAEFQNLPSLRFVQ
jgi:hypothetical protein